MSVEVHVFFRGEPPSKAALFHTMKALEFPLAFAPGVGSLATHTGYVPMRWKGDDTGFEFALVSDPDDLAEWHYDGVDPQLDRCAVFRVSSDATELFAAQATAVAFAKLTAGVVCEPQEDRALTLDEAVAMTRRTLNIVSPSRQSRLRGTQLTDIKHYLKPLLKERTDLVLRERDVFTKPVRHFLRGVFLGRSSDRYRLGVSRMFTRLYAPPGSGMTEGLSRDCHVWQPYFTRWLFDVLRYDVFDTVGHITSIKDLADYTYQHGYRPYEVAVPPICLLDYLLAGERDRAEALLHEFEQVYHPTFVRTQRMLFEQNIDELCAECHRQEAEKAKALGLGNAWEPAPFPIEIPKPARARQTDEAPFAVTSWPVTREVVVVPPPSAPGETAFARDEMQRDGTFLMIGPVARETAKALHDNQEKYSMFARPESGGLVILQRWSTWSPLAPGRSRPAVFWERLILRFSDPSEFLEAQFDQDRKTTAMRLVFVHHIRDSKVGTIWIKWEEEQLYHDVPMLHAGHHQPLTEQWRSVCEIALPPFGEYTTLLACAHAALDLRITPA